MEKVPGTRLRCLISCDSNSGAYSYADPTETGAIWLAHVVGSQEISAVLSGDEGWKGTTG